MFDHFQVLIKLAQAPTVILSLLMRGRRCLLDINGVSPEIASI